MLGNKEAKRRVTWQRRVVIVKKIFGVSKTTPPGNKKIDEYGTGASQGLGASGPRHLPVCKIEDQETSGRNAGQEEASIP